MAKICETCDTKNRLGMCEGRAEEFRYCVRRTGSISNIPGSITPFNEIDEIFKNPVYDRLDHKSVFLDEEYYGSTHHMKLLFGRWKHDEKAIDDNYVYHVGYVIC